MIILSVKVAPHKFEMQIFFFLQTMSFYTFAVYSISCVCVCFYMCVCVCAFTCKYLLSLTAVSGDPQKRREVTMEVIRFFFLHPEWAWLVLHLYTVCSTLSVIYLFIFYRKLFPPLVIVLIATPLHPVMVTFFLSPSSSS